ncbi:hypothetical protein QAD02_010459 [Eretmocerus hayati]|uniref:Uncharacterized protein n=1 Tax=Eretmocerus hayati TaxID=131215 RepID=A0ACC2NUY4_9HYME|nr:hypothetical protein QAD02_010459 [Eretmocerus hayati]
MVDLLTEYTWDLLQGDKVMVQQRMKIKMATQRQTSPTGNRSDKPDDASDVMEIGGSGGRIEQTPSRPLFVHPGLSNSRQRLNSNSSQASNSSQRPKRKRIDAESTQKMDINESVTCYYDTQDKLMELLNEKQTNSSKITIQAMQEIWDYLDKMSRCITTLATEAARTSTREEIWEQTVPTHGDIAAKQAPKTPRIPPIRGAKSTRQQPKRHTAFIRVQDKNLYPEAETQTILKETIDPTRDKIQIRSVRKMRSGAVAVDVATERDLQSLIESEKLKDSGLVVEQPSKKTPKSIVHDVPATYDEQTFKETTYEQNSSMFTGLTKNDVARGITVRFKGRRPVAGTSAQADRSPYATSVKAWGMWPDIVKKRRIPVDTAQRKDIR